MSEKVLHFYRTYSFISSPKTEKMHDIHQVFRGNNYGSDKDTCVRVVHFFIAKHIGNGA